MQPTQLTLNPGKPEPAVETKVEALAAEEALEVAAEAASTAEAISLTATYPHFLMIIVK